MVKNSLSEKIRIIGFWTFGGVFWYLVIAFFLKSNYPIFIYGFDNSEAYNVLKDALSLAAAFLAPVAAFVLFNDWRSEHNIKSLFTLLDDIKKATNAIEDNLKSYNHKVYHPDRVITNDFQTASENLICLSQLTNLNRLLLELKEKDLKHDCYLNLLDEFGEIAHKAKGNLEMMDYSRYVVKKYEETLTKYQLVAHKHEIDFHRKFFADHMHSFNKLFEKVKEINQMLITHCENIKKQL